MGDLRDTVLMYLASVDAIGDGSDASRALASADAAFDALRAAAAVSADIKWLPRPPTESEVIAHHAAHSFSLEDDEDDRVSLWLCWSENKYEDLRSVFVFKLNSTPSPWWLGCTPVARLKGDRWMPLTAARMPAPWPKVNHSEVNDG